MRSKTVSDSGCYTPPKFVAIATKAYVNVDGETFTSLYALGDDGFIYEDSGGPYWEVIRKYVKG
jgi:hypothetical protein